MVDGIRRLSAGIPRAVYDDHTKWRIKGCRMTILAWTLVAVLSVVIIGGIVFAVRAIKGITMIK